LPEISAIRPLYASSRTNFVHCGTCRITAPSKSADNPTWLAGHSPGTQVAHFHHFNRQGAMADRIRYLDMSFMVRVLQSRRVAGLKEAP
jgi:hypothetical protein